MLDYRYQTFITLSKTLNYTQASLELNLSQPAVTQHIQYLQNDLGVPLFNYQNRHLKLTKQGIYLLERLEQILPEIEITRNTLQNKQTIKIGCGRTVGEYILFEKGTPLTSFFNRKDIELSIDTTSVLLTKLQEGQIDIGIIAGILNSDNYNLTPFIKQELIGVCAVDNNRAMQAHCLADLLPESLILREEGSGVTDILKQKFHNEHLKTQDFERCSQIATTTIIKKRVSENRGVSFLFEASVEKELKNQTLKKIPLEQLFIEYFYLVTLKGKKIDPQIMAELVLLQQL
ncbi:LysR family transcriptional regulator [Enterococcus sp. AZ194]|uniref:LysR family transcriptional regulator n=1 Tax=Enterococcus sp. AZ194 TaxID=2774629 RepID=UPI003F684139